MVEDDFNLGEEDSVVTLRLMWGVAGIDDTTAERWDPEKFGELLWDD